ncbi:type VI secretion system-associated FHA domain protein TagH [Nitrosomonas sp.]|uniref:type VI secretion system-associated FHA domain protein TagH n=1 Tax=Nitrosomonas sp. TaxID=42353 RepID=UPI00284C760F|nr:type VI secretion system-associated FHA domain protein TagH [Nitrosomonas sp.]MDR4515593.1 type VI secretion system-associated FHA domain protein TagH [Nitrosomonas sp.]
MIKIKIFSCNGLPSSQLIEATFDELGGTIGRAENGTLVLPDPKKHISRLHARIDCRHGQYFICNYGSATPVVLNGQPLEKEQSEAIKAGDEIRIGGYVMQVLADEQSVASLLNSADKTNPDNQKPGMDFFAEPVEASFDKKQHPSEKSWESDLKKNHLDSADPFADPFEKNKSQEEISGLIPDSYDPFADLPPSDGLSNGVLSEKNSNDLFSDQASQKNEQGIDDYINTKTPLDDLPRQSDISKIDPLVVLEGAAKKNGQPDLHPQRDDALELHGSFDLPGRQFEDEVKKAQQPVSVASGQQFSPGDSSLLDAFLAGAGMQGRNLQSELTPEFLYRVGLILRTSTQGTLDLLLARSMTKQEMRANMTLIAPKENNPLKFSPDVETALMHLLAQQSKGFMAPEQAIRDAYEDLRSHQFGFMAGMRAALAGLLEKFKPSRLEKRFTQVTLMDKLIPGNRKAKFWDSYTERYEEISREAEEDFHILLGKEFLSAYEQQVAKFAEKK